MPCGVQQRRLRIRLLREEERCGGGGQRKVGAVCGAQRGRARRGSRKEHRLRGKRVRRAGGERVRGDQRAANG